MRILGVSAFYHDSAAALVIDGQIVAAAQEERFTRKKHDSRYPEKAIEFCLRQGNLKLKDIDRFVFYDKPFLKFDRLIETYLAIAPKGFTSFTRGFPLWVKDKLFQKKIILRHLQAAAPAVDWKSKLLFSEHHLSHAASAFYPSPFERAVILTMDGVGEWAASSVAIGDGANISPVCEMHFPHSLGLLYSTFTAHLGFKVNSGEYKVMGLAPYGEPKYRQKILENLMDLKPDGSFRLNLKYFDFCTGLKMYSREFERLFGPARAPEDALETRHLDLAASIQSVCEEVVLRIARHIRKKTGEKNLCLAGGVALNCVANGRILKEKIFENVWIQPAAGDAGGAIGAALSVYHLHLKNPKEIFPHDAMRGAYLGPEFSQGQIEAELESAGAQFETLTEIEVRRKTVAALVEGKAVGWHQGRAEFGPRALGNRSILADPRSMDTHSSLNLKVKFRESFRPFAPAVLEEDVAEWFETVLPSPYMLFTSDIAESKRLAGEAQKFSGLARLKDCRSLVPAVTHVDYSARLQTVSRDTNPLFHALLAEFKAATSCPMLVNTSFNVRGEPIVNSPRDAFRCFMGTDIEVLVVGNCYLEKRNQNSALAKSYRNQFELD